MLQEFGVHWEEHWDFIEQGMTDLGSDAGLLLLEEHLGKHKWEYVHGAWPSPIDVDAFSAALGVEELAFAVIPSTGSLHSGGTSLGSGPDWCVRLASWLATSM